MKKLISLALAVLMLAVCALGFAENTLTAEVFSSEGSFDVTFQLPEGASVLSSGWNEGNLFQANILLKKGEYLYLAIDGSAPVEGQSGLTYNEENGYDDEKLLAMADAAAADEYEHYDKKVVTTDYGTKIVMIRVNDAESPMAYAWSVWNGFEVGITLTNEDENGVLQPVTDEQVENMTAFISETWMYVHITEAGDEEAAGAEAELSPENEEVRAVSEWLGSTLSEDNAAEALDWDLDTVRSRLETYDGELKYHTRDELAETIYAQIVLMKQFLAAIEEAGGMDQGFMYMIEPIFDGTKWVADGCVAEIVFQDGLYKAAVAPTFEDIVNGTEAGSYLCEPDENQRMLVSIGSGMEEDGQKDQGLNSTFTAIDEDDSDVLVWKNADGAEVRFVRYDDRYIGRFESDGYVMEVTWENARYKMSLGKTWEDIENDAEGVLKYLARQGAGADNLNGIYDENNPQADRGYCYFCQEYDGSYSFDNGNSLELTFTKAEE